MGPAEGINYGRRHCLAAEIVAAAPRATLFALWAL